MTWGVEVRNGLKLTDRYTRIVELYIAINSNGSVTVPQDGGKPFAFLQMPNMFQAGRAPKITISGYTISWQYFGLNATLIYGVY